VSPLGGPGDITQSSDFVCATGVSVASAFVSELDVGPESPRRTLTSRVSCDFHDSVSRLLPLWTAASYRAGVEKMARSSDDERSFCHTHFLEGTPTGNDKQAHLMRRQRPMTNKAAASLEALPDPEDAFTRRIAGGLKG
jgi:hypothetical protein